MSQHCATQVLWRAPRSCSAFGDLVLEAALGLHKQHWQPAGCSEQTPCNLVLKMAASTCSLLSAHTPVVVRTYGQDF